MTPREEYIQAHRKARILIGVYFPIGMTKSALVHMKWYASLSTRPSICKSAWFHVRNLYRTSPHERSIKQGSLPGTVGVRYA